MQTRMYFVPILLLALISAAHAQKPANAIDASAMFSELHANAPVGGCVFFWMAKGTGEVVLPVWRNFSAVAEASGQHTDHIPGFNAGLSLVSGMGRLRMEFPPTPSSNPTARHSLVACTDSTAPSQTTSANCLPAMTHLFAMAIGGGIDFAVSRPIWIRAEQADYRLL